MNIFANMDPRDVESYKNGTYVYGRCHCGETYLVSRGTSPTKENRTYLAPMCHACADAFAEGWSGGPVDP